MARSGTVSLSEFILVVTASTYEIEKNHQIPYLYKAKK